MATNGSGLSRASRLLLGGARVVLGLSLVALAAASAVRIGPALAATPPNSWADPKPATLPLRLPWKSGDSHVLGAWRYNQLDASGVLLDGTTQGGNTYSQKSDHTCGPNKDEDCYAFDVVGLTTTDEIYAMFPGHVVYAGCAGPNGFEGYGLIVYIETRIGNDIYGALYAHLSSLTPSSSGVSTATGSNLTANDPIGMAGSSYTVVGSSPLDCSHQQLDPSGSLTNVHLHTAVYHYIATNPNVGAIDPVTGVHATSWLTSAGAPHDGRAVVPEPLVGAGVYENFAWWCQLPAGYLCLSTPLTAADLAASGSPSPDGYWTAPQSGTSDGKVHYGSPVTFAVHVSDPVAIKEVHFTASYPGWAMIWLVLPI